MNSEKGVNPEKIWRISNIDILNIKNTYQIAFNPDSKYWKNLDNTLEPVNIELLAINPLI